MSITQSGPVPGSRRVSPDNDYQITVTEDWHVITNDTSQSSTNPLFFVGDPMFPAIGSAHSSNSLLIFRSFGNAQQESRNKWLFSGMEWSTQKRDGSLDFTTERYDDPFRADRSWRFTTRQHTIDRARVADPTGGDKFTRPIPLSAFSSSPEPVATKEVGEPMTGLQAIQYIPVCTYTRNETNPPAALISGSLVGSVNSDSIIIDGFTVPPRTCLLQDAGVSSVKQGLSAAGTRTSWRTVTYQLAINNRGWDLEALNKGFWQITTTKNGVDKPERIRLPDGVNAAGENNRPRPAATPQLLDFNGKHIRIDPGDPAGGGSLDDAHWRVFMNTQSIPFAGFNFS